MRNYILLFDDTNCLHINTLQIGNRLRSRQSYQPTLRACRILVSRSDAISTHVYYTHGEDNFSVISNLLVASIFRDKRDVLQDVSFLR